MFRSLRVRMAASHALIISVILVALGTVGYALLDRSLDRAVTSELTTAANAQLESIAENGLLVPPVDSDKPSRTLVRIAVFDPTGIPVGEPEEVPQWLHPYRDEVTDSQAGGEPIRVVTVSSAAATVVAGRSLAPEDALLRRVRLLSFAGGGVGVVLALIAGSWLAGRAVRPIERAYEAQAGFAADASHELRTPLTFVRSGVEVLAEHDPELGAHVLSEIDYLTALTQRLLLLARTERGKAALEIAPMDLGAVCRSAARRSERASATSLRLEGVHASARGDRIATEAALDAVLENVAVHAGGRATVRWRGDGDRATISVIDHGPGLGPELLDQVFERFTRADPSRTRATGGAGLGLALARTLIQAQGGSLWLERTPGGGLTARIALPGG
ncbi:MAG TPA: HAMP domain-containing sensor histidine kinase [Actinomycetota bacterium]|nr:HAMP domain-containing sensor histidine kinase [Actinomycetota bacterium]